MKKAAQKRMQLQTQATNSANTPYNSKARRLRITVVQRVSGATRYLQLFIGGFSSLCMKILSVYFLIPEKYLSILKQVIGFLQKNTLIIVNQME